MVEQSPYFSVVVPTYNRAKLIPTSLRSLVAQVDSSFECIVVDDGSTDDTRQAVESFGDSRIRYVRKANGERGAARNFGTKLARGVYVYYLDSDDRVTIDHFAHARQTLEKLGRPAVLHARIRWQDFEGRRAAYPQRYPADLQHAIFRRNFVASALFVRRDVALARPYREERDFTIGEDWYHAMVLACEHEIHLTEKATRYLLLHPEQTTRSIDLAPYEVSGRRLLASLRESEIFMATNADKLPLIQAEVDSWIAMIAARRGDRRHAILHAFRAIKENPALLADVRTLAMVKNLVTAAGIGD